MDGVMRYDKEISGPYYSGCQSMSLSLDLSAAVLSLRDCDGVAVKMMFGRQPVDSRFWSSSRQTYSPKMWSCE